MFLDDRPYRPVDTDLKKLVHINMDEALTGLEENLQGLDDEILATFPTEGCNNISWVTMHTLQVFDQYCVLFQRGHSAVDSGKFWVINTPPADTKDPYPGRREIFETLEPVRSAIFESLQEASEEDLLGRRHVPEEWQGNALDAYVRGAFHAMTHLRQIWAIRGALGLTCKKTMPKQLWF
jgi:hypothetical protein